MKANRKIACKTKECLQVRNDILKIEKKEFHIGQGGEEQNLQENYKRHEKLREDKKWKRMFKFRQKRNRNKQKCKEKSCFFICKRMNKCEKHTEEDEEKIGTIIKIKRQIKRKAKKKRKVERRLRKILKLCRNIPI